MQIRVNGKEQPVEAGLTIGDFLAQLGHHPRTVAIEYNGEILKRDRFGEVGLEDGDRLEIVRFVQGG